MNRFSAAHSGRKSMGTMISGKTPSSSHQILLERCEGGGQERRRRRRRRISLGTGTRCSPSIYFYATRNSVKLCLDRQARVEGPYVM